MPSRGAAGGASAGTSMPAASDRAATVPSRTRVRRQPSRSNMRSQTQLSSASLSTVSNDDATDLLTGPDALVMNVKQAIDIWQGLTVPMPAASATDTSPEPAHGLSAEEELAMRDSEEIRQLLRQHRRDQAQTSGTHTAHQRGGQHRKPVKDMFNDADLENRTLAEMVRGVVLERVRRELDRDAWIFE